MFLFFKNLRLRGDEAHNPSLGYIKWVFYLGIITFHEVALWESFALSLSALMLASF